MRRGRVAPVASGGPAALFVTCDQTVFAFESALVDRIVLIDELEVIVEPSARERTAGVVALGGARMPAWDLAGLLTGGSAGEAWIVLRGAGDVERFALRTGRCACVRALPTRVALPRSLHTAFNGAVRSAFRLDTVPELVGHPCGYEVTPHELLGERERAQVGALRRQGSLP